MDVKRDRWIGCLAWLVLCALLLAGCRGAERASKDAVVGTQTASE